MENETKKTGWIAYYICDSSGIGWKDPKYVNFDVTGMSAHDVREEIVSAYEQWTDEASSFSFRYDENVVPPLEIIEAKIKEQTLHIENAVTYLHALNVFKEEHYER